MLAIEGKLLPQKQVFGHESSSRLKSRPQELAEGRSETEEDRNQRSYWLHSSGILPNGHRDWNGKDTGRTPGTNRKKTVGFLHFASPRLVFAHHKRWHRGDSVGMSANVGPDLEFSGLFAAIARPSAPREPNPA